MGGLSPSSGRALWNQDTVGGARMRGPAAGAVSKSLEDATAAQSWHAAQATVACLVSPEGSAASAAAMKGQSAGMAVTLIAAMPEEAAAIWVDMPSAAHMRKGSRAIMRIRMKERTGE